MSQIVGKTQTGRRAMKRFQALKAELFGQAMQPLSVLQGLAKLEAAILAADERNARRRDEVNALAAKIAAVREALDPTPVQVEGDEAEDVEEVSF